MARRPAVRPPLCAELSPINEYRTYRLRAPQRGFYWARSGRDAILVRPNGTIVEVRPGLFR
ncbi:RcnB family protein [Sphingomonas sp. MA1305]|uniref:RcnB family protein n=1 Tax=Sphingomonas sp. MA1305 TaxID=2479204 RepID=UPI003FA6F23E